MTISSEVRKAGPFAGNDVTDTFPFAFKVFSTADVLAVSADSFGLETDLTEGVDYTVSLNANQNANPGGTVTLTSPLSAGYTLVLTSQVQNLQPTDLNNQGGFYPAVINAALDRATIQIQQLSEKVDRSAKLPITRTEDFDSLWSDIVVLADNLSIVNTVAGSIGSVNTVAGVSADVSTVAGNIANINAAVADLPSLAAKVSKTGDETIAGVKTFSSSPKVPAGATGDEAPQAQEIFGKSQTEQTVARTSGVTYTNSTGKPIVVTASATSTAEANGLSGFRNGALVVWSSWPESSTPLNIEFVVFPGDTYKLEANLATGLVVKEYR
ncbi:MAG: hypothetical protein WDA10_15325 [Porticoccaceae bacterium]